MSDPALAGGWPQELIVPSDSVAEPGGFRARLWSDSEQAFGSRGGRIYFERLPAGLPTRWVFIRDEAGLNDIRPHRAHCETGREGGSAMYVTLVDRGVPALFWQPPGGGRRYWTRLSSLADPELDCHADVYEEFSGIGPWRAWTRRETVEAALKKNFATRSHVSTVILNDVNCRLGQSGRRFRDEKGRVALNGVLRTVNVLEGAPAAIIPGGQGMTFNADAPRVEFGLITASVPGTSRVERLFPAPGGPRGPCRSGASPGP